MKKAVIVIPTYNEAKNIPTLVEKIEHESQEIKNWEIHLLVVDSTSPDKTGEIVKTLQKKNKAVHLLVQGKLGMGKAYSTGFSYAIEHLSPTIIFEMDADLSHDPKMIPQFISQIEKGADFVIGSRYIQGGAIPQDWGLHRKLFSILGNIIIRLGFMKLHVTDWTSGYRAIKVGVVKSALNHIQKYSGYVFQVALLDHAIKHGAQVVEVPIVFTDRLHGKSKINSLQYIIHTLLYTFFYSSFIRYVLVGLSGALIDFGISFLVIEVARIPHSLYWLATVVSAECAIIWNFILNNFWSFSYKKIKLGFLSYVQSFLKFNFVGVGALIIQAVGVQLATNVFGPDLWYVYKILIIGFIVIPYSYILYNKVVWKDK